ncbi:MAG: hypothetical protein C4339_01500 [Nitrososphaerota archaeon]
MVDLAFIALASLTVGAAVLSLEARQLVYGAVSLALFFLFVGGLFALLGAPFLAMFQIFINVGAVAVLIIFTVMLVSPQRWQERRPREARLGLVGLLITLFGLVPLLYPLVQGVGLLSSPPTLGGELGSLLLERYGLALVLLAFLLAAAIAASVTLAKEEKG